MKAEEALPGISESLRSYIEHIADLLIVIGSRGIVTYVGPSVERLLGYKPEEIMGTEGYWLVHPDNHAVTQKAIENAARNPGIPTPPMEIRCTRKDGSLRLFEAIGTFLSDISGGTCLVINIWDITERRDAENALKLSELRFRTYSENASDLFLSLIPSTTLFMSILL